MRNYGRIPRQCVRLDRSVIVVVGSAQVSVEIRVSALRTLLKQRRWWGACRSAPAVAWQLLEAANPAEALLALQKDCRHTSVFLIARAPSTRRVLRSIYAMTASITFVVSQVRVKSEAM